MGLNSKRNYMDLPTGPSLCFDERLPFTPFSNLLPPPPFLFDAIFAHSCLRAASHISPSYLPGGTHKPRLCQKLKPMSVCVAARQPITAHENRQVSALMSLLYNLAVNCKLPHSVGIRKAKGRFKQSLEEFVGLFNTTLFFRQAGK